MQLKKDISVSISLKHDKHDYSAGECLAGEISWSNQKANIELELRLGWIISNGRFHDIMCHACEKYVLSEGGGVHDFEITLPQGPHSVSGKVFNIQWLLEAQSDKKEVFIQIPITLAPAS